MLIPYKSFNNEVSGIQAACDEVGRGSIAGRLYVACVIWNPMIHDNIVSEIKDSKKISANKRKELSEYIKENAIDYSINFMESWEIDSKNNILKCTLETMHKCLDDLLLDIDNIIIDGNKFIEYKKNNKIIPHECIIGGDNKYISIAAASILAKVAHDEHIFDIHKEYPLYDWNNNMGYGSQKHLKSINKYGITKYHRKTYSPIKNLIKITI